MKPIDMLRQLTESQDREIRWLRAACEQKDAAVRQLDKENLDLRNLNTRLRAHIETLETKLIRQELKK